MKVPGMLQPISHSWGSKGIASAQVKARLTVMYCIGHPKMLQVCTSRRREAFQSSQFSIALRYPEDLRSPITIHPAKKIRPGIHLRQGPQAPIIRPTNPVQPSPVQSDPAQTPLEKRNFKYKAGSRQ